MNHLLLLLRIPSGLFLCLPGGFIDLRVHTVHTFRPLPIDHTLFLLSGQNITKKMINYQICYSRSMICYSRSMMNVDCYLPDDS